MSISEPLRAKIVWTYDDLQAMPHDHNRYEVIDGELFVTPAPATRHQRLSKRVEYELIVQLEQKGLGVVYHAPVDVIFSNGRVVQPDVVVVAAAKKAFITDRGIETAPALIVEIISPGTARADREIKLKLYASEGVGEYWIADPALRTIEVLTLTPTGYTLAAKYGPGETLASKSFPVAMALDPLFAPD